MMNNADGDDSWIDEMIAMDGSIVEFPDYDVMDELFPTS